MSINNIVTALRNAQGDTFVDAIDGGAGAGIIEIFTAAFGTLLGTLTFSDPAFGDFAAGVGTASAITGDASADATGTAAVCRFSTSTPTTQFEGTVGTAGADINFNTVAFTAGDSIDITSMTITMPAS